MEANHLEHLTIFLTNLNDASCDFAECAKQRGVTRRNNALRDFKAMMKKYGLNYDGKKFEVIGDSNDDQSTPATLNAGKKATPRKRKTQDGEEATGEDGEGSPKKKATKKPQKKDVKAENDEEGVENDDDAEV